MDDSCDYLVIRKDDKKLIGMIENVKDNKFTLLNEEQNKGYEDEIIKLIELKILKSIILLICRVKYDNKNYY